MSELDDVVREYDCFDEESAVIQACATAELAQLRAALKNAEEIAAIYAANNSALMVALDEVIDLAEEGIGYTSQYFREKWNMDGRLSDLKKNITTPEKEAAMIISIVLGAAILYPCCSCARIYDILKIHHTKKGKI